MKKLIPLLFAIFACGAPADEPGIPQEYVPGQQGRIDGSVYDDGWFNPDYPEAKAEFCAMDPDAWFCSDLGTSEQAFTTHQYFGGTQSSTFGTCYGPAQHALGYCQFPKLKQFEIKLNATACFHPIPGLPAAQQPTLQQAQAMVDGFIEGMKLWNGVGGAAVASTGGGTPTWYQDMNVFCQEIGTALGDHAADVPFESFEKKADLPVAPNGRDAGNAYTYDKSRIRIDIQSLWQHIRGSTQCGPNPTLTQIKNTAKRVGTHEMGHGLGLNHFTFAGNIMHPNAISACSPSISIHSAFVNAVAAYDSTNSTLATVLTGNLGSQNPQ